MYDLNDLTTTKEFAYQFCEKYNMEHTKDDVPAGEAFDKMIERVYLLCSILARS